MNPADNPFSKEAQLARSTSQAKKEKLARKKGQEAEKKALIELAKQIGQNPSNGRVNNQRRAGGGLGIADITVKGLPGWHIESKAEKNFRHGAYWKQLDEDCPPDKIKINFYTNEQGRRFIQFEADKLFNVAQDVVLAAGFEII